MHRRVDTMHFHHLIASHNKNQYQALAELPGWGRDTCIDADGIRRNEGGLSESSVIPRYVVVSSVKMLRSDASQSTRICLAFEMQL